jgi:transposase
MSIIGCDLHTLYQVIAMLEKEAGEIVTRRLEHANGEAKTFYAGLPKGSLIGIEATAYTQWFEGMVKELGHELWVGDPAEIRARAVRRQKTDTRDAEHLLDLLLSQKFPQIWVPTPEERDLRQLLKHRDKLVRMQTSVRNQLHFLAMSQGVCRKKKLWTAKGRAELEALSLGPWASQRRKELLELLDSLEPRIEELNQAVRVQAERRWDCRELMKVKGAGPVVSLAYVLTLGPVERFPKSRKVVSYLGLNPSEHSSGGHQRLGHISKQGNSLLRWLLVEAGQSAARFDPELRRRYQRLKFRRGSRVAKVALARHLAVRFYWTLRQAGSAPPPVPMSGSPEDSVEAARPSRS